MLVRVTLEDIICGEPGSCSACPIAQAITRACTPNPRTAKYVFRVSSGHVGVSARGTGTSVAWIELPREVRDFIRNFDVRNHVAPFEFDMPELDRFAHV